MMCYYRFLFSTLFVFSTLFLIFPAYAFEDDCLNFHVIHNPPLGYIEEDGQHTGIHWEFLTAIEDSSGLCINKKLIPYARIWKSIEHGHHDGGIVFRSPDRDQLVKYVAPILTLRTVVIPRKNITFNTYDDLKDIVIGKVRGTRLGNRFDNDTDLTTLEMNNYELVLEMMKRQRVDAMAGSGMGLIALTAPEAEPYVNLDGKFILGERTQWLQLSRKSNHLYKCFILREAIDSLVADGTFEAIMAKYYGPNWKKANE